MPPIYVKPENALRRTEELLALNTTSSEVQAFENLSEVFQSKRFKHTPTNVLEPIVLKYLDLCISGNRKHHARAALVHYRNAVQGTSIQSIETALNHFIAKAEERLAEAMEKAQKEVAALPGAKPATEDDDAEDELPLQPSSLLLDAFVDNAGDADRIERRVIAPAQKMCWDAYDISLDVSKSNDRLELIYNDIAHRAFKFCKVHERKSDFRRLCEQRLRKDLSNAAKYAHQQHAVNLQDPETLTRHLDTRFLQLETAVELELWQEAFRSVEDVHGLVAGKKQAKPSMMANYYEKVTQIFHAEGGKQTAVFHAAAWARYFQYAERAGTVAEKAPGCVLLSALAVPLGEIETKQRLITLLNLPKMPSRDALVKDAAAKHLRRVSPEIRQIYHILEVDFQPFKAAKTLAPLLASIPAELQTYLPALREVVLARMLLELAKVYDTITLSHVLNLVKPFDGTAWETDMPSLEKYLVNAARSGEIKASVDHVKKAITFETKAVDAHRVSNLAACLYNALQYLQPAPATIRAEAFAKALAEAEEERKMVQHKRQIVNKRRELLEEANIRREREESTAKAERARVAAEEQAKRERDAAKQAEVDRLQKQMEATRRDEARKLAEQLAAKGALKVDITKLETLDSSEVLAMQVQQLDKEKRDLNDRSRIVAKRVDHLERAYRKEERPLLADDYERQKEEDKRAHERAQAEARQAAIEQQALSVETKKRLARMMPDYLEARRTVESLQEAQFEQARKAAQKKIEEEKEKFRKKVLERRKQEREAREAERQRQEEEDRIAREQEEEEERRAAEKEEAERQAKAEEEAKKAEAEEKAAEQRRAREAQRAADAELIRKQREREEEAERRRAERASGPGGLRRPMGGAPAATGGAASSSSAAPPAAVAGLAAAGGGWREKLAAKKAAEAAGGGAAAAPSPTSNAAYSPSSGGMGRPSPSGSPAPTAEGGAPAPERGGAYRRGMGLSRGGASSSPSTRGGAGGAGGSRW